MAFRQVGAARRRLIRKLSQRLEEDGFFMHNRQITKYPESEYKDFSGQFSVARYVKRFEFSACEFFLHRHTGDESSRRRNTLFHEYMEDGVSHGQICTKISVFSGLRKALDGSSCLDGRRFFSSQTRVLFEPVAPSAGTTPSSSYQHGDDSQKIKKLEPSAEECEQAVVGLTSAKAKVKHTQDVVKKGESSPTPGNVTRIWNMILGIGLALKVVLGMNREDWTKKVAGWKKHIWQELQHYWLGLKLLWADVRISSRLLMKLAFGKSWTRRERQQLTRTAADIFRLVPFAVFIIVPFMEFLLPIALKLFPNMLPSTFRDKMKEQEELKKRLHARIQYAKFLQDTVTEMAKELKSTRTGELQRSADDLDEFMTKVRTGGDVTNDEILHFAKLFNDELTLDNISRRRLVSMCKYMGIQPYGTDAYLRYSLRTKLNWIKTDDRLIQAEGVESLSEVELRAACRERGMLGLLSVDEMRQQLKDWLDLSLKKSVPSSLLILSRAFMVSGRIRPDEPMHATLSSLPEKVLDSIGTVAASGEDAIAERKRKLEFLKQQEALIKKENVAVQRDTGKHTGQHVAESKPNEKKEELCKISSALAVLASASFVSKKRAEFLRLVNREIQLYNNMIAKEGTPEEAEARRAYRAAQEDSDHVAEFASRSRVSSALTERVDALLHKLEKELDYVDARIGDRWRILDRSLKVTLGQQNFQELISNLAKDEVSSYIIWVPYYLVTSRNAIAIGNKDVFQR
ncbi:hypothetical protein R1sor_004341 [Riccia sorocarpa]|uniref:Letm1 RBD domain-containing protein n=1 Tax=Riccia sorocarpa TaxID=122646 RepID=A0ABD3HGG9_9MARC